MFKLDPTAFKAHPTIAATAMQDAHYTPVTRQERLKITIYLNSIA